MLIKEVDIKTEGACNYCDKGQLNKESNGLSYPYKKVIEINGTGVSTRFCSECLSHLVFTAKLNKFL